MIQKVRVARKIHIQYITTVTTALGASGHERLSNGLRLHIPEHLLVPGQIVSTQEQRSFWKEKIVPDAIVFCSSSVRKGLMIGWLAHMYEVLGFRSDQPVDKFLPHLEDNPLWTWFKTHVPNGDGELEITYPIFVGMFRGVELWIQPTGGEGPKNDQPKVEAATKAVYGRNYFFKYEPNSLKRKKIVFIGMDAVESVTTPSGKVNKNGKPINDERFPIKRDGESIEEYEARVQEYQRQYIHDRYPIGSSVEHIVGIAVLASNMGVLAGDQVLTTALTIQYLVQQGAFDGAIIDPHSGGGGLTQWVQSLRYKDVRDEQGDFTRVPMTLQEKAALGCHIMGAPFLQAILWLKDACLKEDFTIKMLPKESTP